MPRTAPPETIRRDGFEAARRLVLEGGPCVVFNGPVGCGAHTLAMQVCDDAMVGARFPDGILWLHIGESPNLGDKWRELYVGLYGDTAVPPDPEAIRRYVA